MPEPEVTPSDQPQTKFYLLGEVDPIMVERFVEPFSKAIDEQKVLKRGMLTIYVQGPGGYIDSLHSILSMIQLAQSAGVPVRTVALGEVASASSLIAIAGTVGSRYIAPHAEHLLHFGSGWSDGETPIELDRSSQRLKRHFKWIESFYTSRCTIPELGKHLQYDQYYLTARQCLRYKLADKLLEDLI